MTKTLHRVAAMTAFLTILCFWLSTIAVETTGDAAAIALVKRAIVWGFLLLIPAIAAAGGSGLRLGGRRQSRVAAAKRKRMPFIALNGVFVLVPCAILLRQWAVAGQFDRTFVIVQTIELIAGAVNLVLLGLNLRDGVKLARCPAC